MRKIAKILVLLLTLSLCFTLFAACDTCKDGHDFDADGKCTKCGKNECDVNGHTWVNAVCSVCGEEYELVDYVEKCKLDMDSPTKKYTAPGIVRMYIDGDTTHFNVPESEKHPDGVLKARYLAVNTPESTGQIEPYGKVASNFTHETLQAAIDNGGSVLVESDTDDGLWNNDSYGRTIAWVWYKPSADAEWRNLNLELLQKGYGYGSSAGQNRYGEYCVLALNQAIQAGLIVFSKLPDENYYYGSTVEVDIKELRTSPERYDGVKVAFEGFVTSYYSGSSYVQWYCEEDDLYYGISVYYNGSNSDILNAMAVGNHVRVVGKPSQFNGTWQVSSLSYNSINPDDPNNTVKLSDDTMVAPDPVELTIPQFNSKRTVEVYDTTEEETIYKEFKLCQLLVDTKVTMKNLVVDHTYTTASGTSKGAISLYCKDAAGNQITVRTEVLLKLVDGKYVTVTADEFEGKTITIVGVVDWYNYNNNNEYQIRVLDYLDIVVVK